MSQYDLSKLYVDFTQCPKGTKLIDHFPELGAFEEFKNADNENQIKIAILTGDFDSPFIRIKDRETMLNAIFDYLGIKKETKLEKEFFSQVFRYRHDKVSGCWVRYIQMMHDTDFTDWLTVQETYNYLLFQSKKPFVDGDEGKYLDNRIKIQNNLKKFGADMKEIEIKLFPDSKAAREAALHENKKIVTYAEMYAEDNTFL